MSTDDVKSLFIYLCRLLYTACIWNVSPNHANTPWIVHATGQWMPWWHAVQCWDKLLAGAAAQSRISASGRYAAADLVIDQTNVRSGRIDH